MSLSVSLKKVECFLEACLQHYFEQEQIEGNASSSVQRKKKKNFNLVTKVGPIFFRIDKIYYFKIQKEKPTSHNVNHKIEMITLKVKTPLVFVPSFSRFLFGFKKNRCDRENRERERERERESESERKSLQ